MAWFFQPLSMLVASSASTSISSHCLHLHGQVSFFSSTKRRYGLQTHFLRFSFFRICFGMAWCFFSWCWGLNLEVHFFQVTGLMPSAWSPKSSCKCLFFSSSGRHGLYNHFLIFFFFRIDSGIACCSIINTRGYIWSPKSMDKCHFPLISVETWTY